MKILYLGAGSGNALKRAHSVRRLGHEVRLIDPLALFPMKDLVGKLTYISGGLLFERFLIRKITSLIQGQYFDITLIDGGELIGPHALGRLRKFSDIIVNYNTDDPFGKRDRNKWRLYLKAVPYYDLLAVVRDVNVSEAYAWRARKVMRVFMSVDELDGPRELTEADYRKFASEVLFIGTWMPERGPFFAALLAAGLPLTIYGNSWHKAPEWGLIKPAWKGPAIYDDDYIKAIQLAKVSLGLLSKGNRDLHTTRTFEIPYCGGLFCGERTPEHLQLYEEGVEAVFWEDAAECIAKCRELLRDEAGRRLMAAKGRERCLKNGIFNGTIMAQVIAAALP
jgi:hypothetical protein